MAGTFTLKVLSSRGPRVNARVVSVVLPGAAGSLGVLRAHEPWTVALKAGEIAYRGEDGAWHRTEIAGGVASMERERTIVLAD